MASSVLVPTDVADRGASFGAGWVSGRGTGRAKPNRPGASPGGGRRRRGTVGAMTDVVAPRRSAGSRLLRGGLLVVAWFNLASALIGMVGLTLGGGLGLPPEWLDGSPFDSYFWPGIILGVVVGGIQALALIADHRRSLLSPGLHAAAGLVMMIWIFVEIAMLLVWSPLHGIYFASGLIQVVLSVLVLTYATDPRP